MPANRTRLSFAQFYNLTEHVRALREYLDRERPTREQAAEILSKKCGFNVPIKALDQACQATGIDWVQRRIKGDSKYKSQPVFQLVFAAIRHMAEAIGMPAPEPLKQAEAIVRASMERSHLKEVEKKAPVQASLPLEAQGK